eukprot:4144816-Ditylum_brightwellii.AAC.1
MEDSATKDYSEYTGEEEEMTVDVEEGQSMADTSYGWSETRVTYNLNNKDKEDAHCSKDIMSMSDLEHGHHDQTQDEERPIYTS